MRLGLCELFAQCEELRVGQRGRRRWLELFPHDERLPGSVEDPYLTYLNLSSVGRLRP